MSSVEGVHGFLEAMRYRDTRPSASGVQEGLFSFVTISRQTGAGGHSLATVLLQAMARESDPLFQGWQVFDHELCKRLVEDPKLRVSMRSLVTEEYHSRIEALLFELMLGETPQDVVMKKIFQTIRTLATVGKVIIVGRAGACVTRGLPLGVHVRLVASEPSRLVRMQQQFHLSEPAARDTIRKQDTDRAKLVRDYFRRDINDPLLYHATWNTDAVSLEAIASAILALVKHTSNIQRSPRGGLRPISDTAYLLKG